MSVHHATAAQASFEHPRANQITSTWSAERVELLKRHFNAGLSCSQIARAIGVTRNAVIGKMNRLGLSRPKDVISAQQEHRLARANAPVAQRPRRTRLNVFVQHEMLAAAFAEAQPRIEDVPIANGCGCTLLELGHATCRWPVGASNTADARFCGNTAIEGLPYCAGHARIAYRPAGRRRSGTFG